MTANNLNGAVMFRRLLTVPLAAALGLVILGQAPAGQDKETKPKATKNDLTSDTFPKLHALVRPHEDEWRHLKVEWITDVVAARTKATKEDKPIVVLYTGGAGYNEPLGVC
jgi:hypothetical protein